MALISPTLLTDGVPFPLKEEMSPVPLKGKPMEALLFDHVTLVPEILEIQITAELTELLHIVSLLTGDNIGVGFIVTLMVSI